MFAEQPHDRHEHGETVKLEDQTAHSAHCRKPFQVSKQRLQDLCDARKITTKEFHLSQRVKVKANTARVPSGILIGAIICVPTAAVTLCVIHRRDSETKCLNGYFDSAFIPS